MQVNKDTPLEKVKELAPPCKCHACSHGCRFGSGILVGDDHENLANFLELSTDKTKKKYLEKVEQFGKEFLRPKLLRKDGLPFGRCIFFDEDIGCKVHPAKPLQCKVSTGCSPAGESISAWFVVNHLVDPDDPESIRQYAQHLKAGGMSIPGGSLKDMVSDSGHLQKILRYDVLK